MYLYLINEPIYIGQISNLLLVTLKLYEMKSALRTTWEDKKLLLSIFSAFNESFFCMLIAKKVKPKSLIAN